jgi:6-phospho-beta-glucosidase
MIPNYYLRYYVHPDRVLRRSSGDAPAPNICSQADLLTMYADPPSEKPALQERGGAYYSTAAVELIRAIAQDRRACMSSTYATAKRCLILPPECAVEVPAVIGKTALALVIDANLPPFAS